MSDKTPFIKATGLAILLSAACSTTAYADALRSNFDFRIVEVDADGNELLVERDTVRPGEAIQYAIVHENLTEDALGGLVVSGPVPEGVTLNLGSEASSLDAKFEIQAEMDPDLEGLEWSGLPALRKVVDEDGTERMEPVPEDSIAAVRWTLLNALPAGETVENSYRVVVN